MDLDTQHFSSSSTHLDDYASLGLDDLPDFECLCELCDCGCFELSKQPHSLNCKKFFNQANRNSYTGIKSTIDYRPQQSSTVRRSNSIINVNESRSNPLAFSGAIGNELPKGVLSEYQCSFINSNSDPKQATKVKIKDNFSLFTDNGKPNEIFSDMTQSSFNLNQSNRVPLRSKALNRLNNMMPSNDGVSWYQADFNFIGTDNDTKSSYNSLNHYKSEYLRNFDELNKGLVDNYSKLKGSPPLISSNNRENAHSRAIHMSQEILKTDEYSKYPNIPKTRPHDFRPVWVPKKYDGRNMFVSHIDSALFPDKERNEYETQYSNGFDSTPEKRVTFDRESYVGKFPSYRYIQNYENKLVPTMKWTQIKERDDYNKSSSSSNEPPSKSIYQADYPTPQIVKKSTLCKAALLQTLMRRDKRLAVKFSKNQPKELKSIVQKRYNDIETYNIF